MKWSFPKLSLSKTLDEQCSKIREEVSEFEIELDSHNKDLEAIDIYHAAESLLRIHFSGREDVLDSIILEVIEKNRKRGKY